MKNTNTKISLEELRENLASATAEVAKINNQLKATRKTRRAYEKLEAALKEQRKAARKVERALQRVIDAQEEQELAQAPCAIVAEDKKVVRDDEPLFEILEVTPEEEASSEDFIREGYLMVHDDFINDARRVTASDCLGLRSRDKYPPKRIKMPQIAKGRE